jgi:hypothetical protein
VRQLVHAVGPQITQTIKRTNHTYFVLEGFICALLAAKGHVNVFVYDGASSPTPRGSSQVAMTTRPPAPWPSGTAKQSTQPR